MYKFGPIQKKILLVLLGGMALGLSNNHRQYFRTLKTIRKDWQNINLNIFRRSIKRLSDEKLVEEKYLSDGSIKLLLTEKGRKQAKRISLLGKSIKFRRPKSWDRKWRLVVFDIPEKDRLFRDILRDHLKALKFYKLQHSVFISPYPFEKEILELIKIYAAEPYVRVITATRVDNENVIKRHFFKK